MKSKSEKENGMLGLAAEKDKLSELQTKLNALHADRLKLERQKAQQNDFLEGIASRRPALTKALAHGDTTAGTRLDNLETEERAVRRTLEGIEGHLTSLAAEITPVETELTREQTLEAARIHVREGQALKARGDSDSEEFRASFLKTQALYVKVLANAHDANANYLDLDGSHWATRWYEALNVNLRLVNEGWMETLKRFGGSAAIHLRPLVPPKR
jgi:hypothetical protein